MQKELAIVFRQHHCIKVILFFDLIRVGRRICLGEHLAKMELFIFFSYFMHRFTFMKPADAPPLTLEGKNSITFSPLPFEICALQRD